ncbi:MAG: hypothetical protein IIZ33_08870 [Erysipelotrichaceae bacterium]|nr:hypothetical protein [Erysipelotrichaceae bacterium]
MRNNKPFQIIIAVILALMLFIAKPVNLRADDTPTMPFNSNYKYSNGVGNITIWLDYSSGVGTWETYINSSANNWMYTGWDNPIYLTFVSSNYGSNMDFHSHNGSWFVTNTGSADVFALTLFFSSSGGSLMGSSGPTASWYYSEIHINDDAFSDDNFPNEGAHGTVRHEMGHAFGLRHNNTNPNSIMHQYGVYRPDLGTYEYRNVHTVQYTDNLAVVNLYSN